MSEGIRKINEDVIKIGRTIIVTDPLANMSRLPGGTLFVDPLLGNLRVRISGQDKFIHFTPGNIFSEKTISESFIVDKTITNQKIKDKTINSGLIADEAINAIHLKPGCVTEVKLSTDAVVTSKIKDLSVTTAKLNSSAVTTDKINNYAVTDIKLGVNSVIRDKIKDGAVNDAKIENVDGSKLNNKSLSGTKIKDYTITESLIGNNAIGSRAVAPNAIGSDKIAPLCIGNGHIADGCITTSKIQNGAITSDKIAQKHISTNHLADGCITAAKIPANIIDSSKLNQSIVNDIARSVKMNTLNIAEVNGSMSITKDLKVAGTITANKVYNAVYNDLAEGYVPGESLEAGDIVEIREDGKVYKATALSNQIVGVVSDEYAACYGASDEELRNGEKVAVGLIGKVHVKVSGVVRIGDTIFCVGNGKGTASKGAKHGKVGKAIASKNSLGEEKVLCLIFPS